MDDSTAARERVREAEERYRTLVVNAIDAMFLTDSRGVILEANPAATAMFGWSEAELRDAGADAILPLPEETRAEAERALEISGRFRGRHTLRRRDGSTLVGDIAISRFQDRTGTRRSTVVIRDVTVDSMARAAVAAAEAKFRLLVEHVLVGVYIIKDDRYVYCNPHLTQILGYSEKDLLARAPLDLIVVEDRDRLAKLRDERDQQPGGIVKAHCRVMRGDGEIAEIEFLSSVIEYEGGAAILGTANDITAGRRALEKLQKSENRYRTLVETAEDIICTLDLDGRITGLNQAFETITGWRVEEWIGRSYEDTLDPQWHASAKEDFDSVIETGSASRRPFYLRTSSGPPVLVEASGRPLVTDGNVVGTIAIIRDVSERRRMQVALERSGRFTALGRLAATIAHEFNNVLMGVQATVDLMQRSPEPGSIAQGLRSLEAGIERGRRMTREVLQFTRMPEPETEPFRLVPLLRSLQAEMDSIVGPSIHVRLDLGARPEATIAGDQTQIQQVLMNLVLNARDAMPGGGTITVSLREQAKPEGEFGSVILSVADTGAGIAEDLLPLIFEPLFTTKKAAGTGLGLAIVAHIVEKHGGTIRVESVVGQGSVFEIVLPLSGRDEVEKPSRVPERSGTVERILIVDDEPMISEGLSAVLELEGIATRTAAWGRDVESAVEQFAPEVVLLDLNLPDMSGRDVYAMLMSRWPSLPVIISSGHADESVVRDFTKGGRAAFLLKPYDVNTLLETVAQVTGLSEG